MAYIVHLFTGVWCSDVGICDSRVCTVLCLAGRVSFSTRVPVQSLTTANQRRTYTRILSPISIWRTRAPKAGTQFTELAE